MNNLQRTWFIHSQGETFGPLNTDVVMLMMKQKRAEYWDFIWTQGLDAWARIADMMPFAELLPAYPDVPIPGDPGRGTVINPVPPQIAMMPPPIPDAPAGGSALPSFSTPAPAAAPQAAPGSSAPTTGSRPIRKHGRAKIIATANIEGYQTYSVHDIAEGGIFVTAEPPIPVGTDVKFKLTSSAFAKTLSMTGVVIRFGQTEDGKLGFGIQFTRVNPAYTRIIREYVTAHEND